MTVEFRVLLICMLFFPCSDPFDGFAYSGFVFFTWLKMKEDTEKTYLFLKSLELKLTHNILAYPLLPRINHMATPRCKDCFLAIILLWRRERRIMVES